MTPGIKIIVCQHCVDGAQPNCREEVLITNVCDRHDTKELFVGPIPVNL